MIEMKFHNGKVTRLTWKSLVDWFRRRDPAFWWRFAMLVGSITSFIRSTYQYIIGNQLMADHYLLIGLAGVWCVDISFRIGKWFGREK